MGKVSIEQVERICEWAGKQSGDIFEDCMLLELAMRAVAALDLTTRINHRAKLAEYLGMYPRQLEYWSMKMTAAPASAAFVVELVDRIIKSVLWMNMTEDSKRVDLS